MTDELRGYLPVTLVTYVIVPYVVDPLRMIRRELIEWMERENRMVKTMSILNYKFGSMIRKERLFSQSKDIPAKWYAKLYQKDRHLRPSHMSKTPEHTEMAMELSRLASVSLIYEDVMRELVGMSREFIESRKDELKRLTKDLRKIGRERNRRR